MLRGHMPRQSVGNGEEREIHRLSQVSGAVTRPWRSRRCAGSLRHTARILRGDLQGRLHEDGRKRGTIELFPAEFDEGVFE